MRLRNNGFNFLGVIKRNTGIHYEGLDGVFPGAAADEIVQIIEMLNANADVAAAA